MRQIFWLASFPKSGNTWCRKFLDAYCCRARLDLTSHHQKYVRGDYGETALQAVTNVPLPKLSHYQRVALRPAMLLHMLYHSDLGTLTLKTHHGRYRADEFELIPPGLTKGAVYLVRDPRAVAPSYAAHMNLSLDEAIEHMTHPQAVLGEGAHHVTRDWSSHVASWVDPRDNHDYPLTVLRYEDLLSDPAGMMRRLLWGLGWNDDQIDPQWFEFALEQSRFDALQAAEAAGGFREHKGGPRFFRHGKADAWRDELSRQQIERIERHCGVMMTRLGYPLEVLTADDLFEVTATS